MERTLLTLVVESATIAAGGLMGTDLTVERSAMAEVSFAPAAFSEPRSSLQAHSTSDA
ncbi:MAG: hypothetical protein ABGZ23_22510 [Fuerstiella sp.]